MTTDTPTAEQRRIIKAYASNRDLKYKISKDGEVHMYGIIPNSIFQGWYLFAQSPEEAVSEIRGPKY